MASTSLADYQVLSDGPFTLDEYEKKVLHWTIPSDFVRSSGSRKPVLAFTILPLEEDTDFNVKVNHRTVINMPNLSKSHTRGLWEAFNAHTAFPEGVSYNNPAPLEITVTSGKARFTDVIVWYQVDRTKW